jgi:hypothetical protein
MTQDKYLEMCESLGSEADPNEIPPAFHELTHQAQDAMEIFMYLKDDWSSMGGYLGKDLSNLSIVFEIFDVPKSDWLLYFELLQTIIAEQTAYVNKKIKAESRTKTSGKTNRTRGSNPS